MINRGAINTDNRNNITGAVSYGYSNIFVTAPSPENLKTVFQFIISGLKALKYTEHLDFEVWYSSHSYFLHEDFMISPCTVRHIDCILHDGRGMMIIHLHDGLLTITLLNRQNVVEGEWLMLLPFISTDPYRRHLTHVYLLYWIAKLYYVLWYARQTVIVLTRLPVIFCFFDICSYRGSLAGSIRCWHTIIYILISYYIRLYFNLPNWNAFFYDCYKLWSLLAQSYSLLS